MQEDPGRTHGVFRDRKRHGPPHGRRHGAAVVCTERRWGPGVDEAGPGRGVGCDGWSGHVTFLPPLRLRLLRVWLRHFGLGLGLGRMYDERFCSRVLCLVSCVFAVLILSYYPSRSWTLVPPSPPCFPPHPHVLVLFTYTVRPPLPHTPPPTIRTVARSSQPPSPLFVVVC